MFPLRRSLALHAHALAALVRGLPLAALCTAACTPPGPDEARAWLHGGFVAKDGRARVELELRGTLHVASACQSDVKDFGPHWTCMEEREPRLRIDHVRCEPAEACGAVTIEGARAEIVPRAARMHVTVEGTLEGEPVVYERDAALQTTQETLRLGPVLEGERGGDPVVRVVGSDVIFYGGAGELRHLRLRVTRGAELLAERTPEPDAQGVAKAPEVTLVTALPGRYLATLALMEPAHLLRELPLDVVPTEDVRNVTAGGRCTEGIALLERREDGALTLELQPRARTSLGPAPIPRGAFRLRLDDGSEIEPEHPGRIVGHFVLPAAASHATLVTTVGERTFETPLALVDRCGDEPPRL